MTLHKKLALICGAAAIALSSTPAPLGLMRTANAQEVADVEDKPDDALAPKDKGAAASQDGDVTDDNAEDAKPDAADNEEGSDDNSVLEDEGAADDQDGDVTDDNIEEAKPDVCFCNIIYHIGGYNCFYNHIIWLGNAFGFSCFYHVIKCK